MLELTDEEWEVTNKAFQSLKTLIASDLKTPPYIWNAVMMLMVAEICKENSILYAAYSYMLDFEKEKYKELLEKQK